MICCGRSRLHGTAYHEWMSRQHVFCYELSVPRELSGEVYRLMQADLARLLQGYTAALEVRPMRCWVLERTGAEDKLKSKGGVRGCIETANRADTTLAVQAG